MQSLRRLQVAWPLTNAACTGFVVMSAGDAAAQLAAGATQIDRSRNLIASSFNGCASPCFFRWYRLMDWIAPGTALRTLVPKVLCSQIFTTGMTNPCFISWCNAFEELSRTGAAADWAAVRARTVEQLRRELPHIYGSSMIFWLPVTSANYAFVPEHLRILWVSSCAVLWGGFVSFVAHRDPESGPGSKHS